MCLYKHPTFTPNYVLCLCILRAVLTFRASSYNLHALQKTPHAYTNYEAPPPHICTPYIWVPHNSVDVHIQKY